jgi:hypothetical protein
MNTANKSKVLTITIIAVATVSLFAILFFVINKNSSTNTSIKAFNNSSSGTNETVSATPSVSPTITVTQPIVTVEPTKNYEADYTLVVDSQNNVIEYTSDELGLTFAYGKTKNGNKVTPKRDNNKVILLSDDPSLSSSNSYFVESFSKKPDETLEQALKRTFINNVSASDCITEKADDVPGFSETAVFINPNGSKKCPTGYTKSDHMGYFAYSSVRKDKFIFISDPEFIIKSDRSDHSWSSSIQMIASN